ncbi:MAG: 1,4-alpha-glucan branching protein GlgB [Puniceicoccales bacterium]|nr:1,4-alpha-glucan branching protein GlgB [Puniceicoccales bacterium]
MTLRDREAFAIAEARCPNPHDILGWHLEDGHGTVRTFLAHAVGCAVLLDEGKQIIPMESLTDCGLFQCTLPGTEFVPYRLLASYADGRRVELEDAYRFPPTISEYDRHLFAEGRAERIHHLLGSHRRTIDGVQGLSFAVWAPNARRISLVGDFNDWDGRQLPLRKLGLSGIWELFVPHLPVGRLYKYELIDANGQLQLRTDPCALCYERAPEAAALTGIGVNHDWQDGEWMAERRSFVPYRAPISIYEVHLASWRRVPEENDRPLTYREAAPLLADYCNELGFTHVELLPITEFPYDGSWGYQVTGYFAPTSRFGNPDDFAHFVDTLHRRGIGVILDWVPGHFPKDRFALARFDGTCLYEHEDARIGEHRNWGTLAFNFGRHEVRNFLIASALSWCERFHIDGFRVDAVAAIVHRNHGRSDGEWLPHPQGGEEDSDAVLFLREYNEWVHRLFPGVLTIAEESTTHPGVSHPTYLGGLGFDFKWNMGWMHDTLYYFSQAAGQRQAAHHRLTFAMLYQYSEHFILALSHDEVVHGKGSLLARMPSSSMDRKADMLRALYGYLWTWPGKKSLFMGGEFGQHDEWYHGRSLDWHLLHHCNHRGLQLWIRDLNRFYLSRPWLGFYDDDPAGFCWINPDDSQGGVLSYLRRGGDELVLVVGNFSWQDFNAYAVGVPRSGRWREVLNGNALLYGGSGIGNLGEGWTSDESCNGFAQKLTLHLPAHSVLVFQHDTAVSILPPHVPASMATPAKSN